MDTPSPTPPPPAPWIGKTPPIHEVVAAAQTWSIRIDSNTLLTIPFPSCLSGYHRYTRYSLFIGTIIVIYVVILGAMLLAVLILGTVGYLILTSHRAITIPYLLKAFRFICSEVGKIEVDFLKSAVVILILPILVLLDSIFPVFRKHYDGSIWIFGSTGGKWQRRSNSTVERATSRLKQFHWRRIRQIRYQDGDISFVTRNPMIDIIFFLPRESFADREAAKRFHEAVTTLWKAEGDLTAIPSEALTEFALK